MRTFLVLCAAFALCSAGNYHQGGYQIFSGGLGGGIHGQFAQTSLGNAASIQSHAVRGANGLYTHVDYKNRQTGGRGHVQGQIVTVTKEVPVHIPRPYPVTVTKEVKVGVPQPYPVHIAKPYPVPVEVRIPVHIPKPYPVKITHQVPVQVPVYVKVPHPVKIEVPVPRPYPVEVVKHVQVKVPTPVYVKVPVPIHTHSHEIQTQNYQAGFGSAGNFQSSGFGGHGLNVQNFQNSYQSSGIFNGYIPSKEGGMYQNQGYNSYASGWKW